MKKLKCTLFIIAVAIIFASCNKPVEVSFVDSAKEFDPQGGTIEVALKSNGDWTIEKTTEWVTVSPTSGSGDATLTLTAGQNTTDENRFAEIKATTKDNTASLTLTQAAVQYYVNLTPRDYECGSDGGTLSVNVSSNINWAVTVPEWMTCSVSDGSNDAVITVNIKPIDSDVSDFREANVVVGNLLAIDKIHVVQYADPVLDIEVNPNVLEFVSTGESKTVSVTTEDTWTAQIGDDWVTLSQMEGQGDADITVVVGENPDYTQRETRVTFVTAGGVEAMLSIRQEASIAPHFLEVSPKAFSFGKNGGDSEINIECDMEWLFDLSDDWLSLSTLSGSGNATVVLTAMPNSIMEARTATFYIKSGDLFEELTVSQEGGEEPVYVIFEPDTIYPTYGGGFQHIDLITNSSWELESSSWIMLITTTGSGDASFDIVIDLNESPEGRIGYVNAKHNGQVIGSLVVVQEGKPNIFETDVTEIEARPEGGDYTIHLTANQSWSSNCDVNWIKCMPDSGLGDSDIVLKVETLLGSRPRTGHMKIVGSTGAQIIVTIEQHQ